MSTAVLKSATDQELRASLFDRWKNRPLPDPNRPRPVMDAIKAMLTQFVAQAGPTLMPMILEMLQKALAGAGTASVSTVVENPATLAEASDLQIVEELQSRQTAEATASAVLPDFEWFKGLFFDAVNYIGPVAVQWVVMQLLELFPEAAE